MADHVFSNRQTNTAYWARENDLVDVDDRLTTAEADIIANETDIGNIDSRVTQNESDIAANDVAITANISNISTNAADITALETQVQDFIVGPASTPDSTIVVFDGVTGKLAKESSVVLQDDTLTGVNSIDIKQNASNPGGGDTIWSSTSGDLFIGSQQLNGTVGPVSSTANAIATWQNTNGVDLKNNAITIAGNNLVIPNGNELRTNQISESTTAAGVTIEQSKFENYWLQLNPSATQPSDSNSLWLNSGTGTLHRDDVDLEAESDGVTGSGSANINEIFTSANVTGDELQASGINATAFGTGNFILTTRNFTTEYDSVGGNNNLFLTTNSLAGQSLTTGEHNISLGRNALNSIAIGSYNIGVGRNSLENCIGSRNISIGGFSSTDLTNADENTVIGYNAFSNATLASNNVIIGNQAGDNVTNGTNNVIIGDSSGGPGFGNISDSIIIGNDNTDKTYLFGVYNEDIGNLTNGSTSQLVITNDLSRLGTNMLPIRYQGIESYTMSADQGSPASISVDVELFRIGSIIFFSIDENTFSASGNPSVYSSTSALPSDYRPNDINNFVMQMITNGSVDGENCGSLIINSNGFFNIDIRVNSWDGLAGFFAFSVCYSANL